MKKLAGPILVFFAVLFSVDAADPKTRTEEATAATTVALALKKPSYFSMDESGRSPFWPIGWKPAPTSADGAVQRYSSEVNAASFVVTSITVERGNRYAIINGKVMGEGQVFGLQAGNETHQITVKAIQDGTTVEV